MRLLLRVIIPPNPIFDARILLYLYIPSATGSHNSQDGCWYNVDGLVEKGRNEMNNKRTWYYALAMVAALAAMDVLISTDRAVSEARTAPGLFAASNPLRARAGML